MSMKKYWNHSESSSWSGDTGQGQKGVKDVYLYDWVTVLYSGNWHHTVNQLHSKKKTASIENSTI